MLRKCSSGRVLCMAFDEAVGMEATEPSGGGLLLLNIPGRLLGVFPMKPEAMTARPIPRPSLFHQSRAGGTVTVLETVFWSEHTLVLHVVPFFLRPPPKHE